MQEKGVPVPGHGKHGGGTQGAGGAGRAALQVVSSLSWSLLCPLGLAQHWTLRLRCQAPQV